MLKSLLSQVEIKKNSTCKIFWHMQKQHLLFSSSLSSASLSDSSPDSPSSSSSESPIISAEKNNRNHVKKVRLLLKIFYSIHFPLALLKLS